MAFGNQILDSLSDGAKSAIRPYLHKIFVQRRDDADARWGEGLLFPIDALVRASLHGENSRPITLLAMGRRSAVGIGRWLGHQVVTELRVLEPGNAWILPLPLESKRLYDGILAHSLSSWMYRSLIVTAYRLACNAEHNVDRRLAHALLWIADETGRPHVSLTHQSLSELAAMRRPSVSIVLSDLQRRGIVRSIHGSIGILDRRRLEGEACPCYQSTRAIMHPTALA